MRGLAPQAIRTTPINVRVRRNITETAFLPCILATPLANICDLLLQSESESLIPESLAISVPLIIFCTSSTASIALLPASNAQTAAI